MKVAWLVALVACSAPATQQQQQQRAMPAPNPAQPVADTAPTPTMHKPRPVIEAPHTGQILELALSPDGAAALTADELGGIRLWPSLDGKQEPRIVSLPPPRQLAVARVQNGFVVVSLDEVGGLYIGKLDATGRMISHVTVPPDPIFTGMAMTGRGLLAWRADQSIVLMDGDGAIRHHITTEPAERIISIAVSGPRALAQIDKDGTRVLRWLSLDRLAWGATLKLDDPDRGDVIALSPSGTRIATVHTDPKTKAQQLQIVDVAKVSVIATGPLESQGNFELGFIDDDNLALGSQLGITWMDAKVAESKALVHADNRGVRRGVAFGVGAGRAVTVSNGELQLSTPSQSQYLGYDIVAPRFVEAAPNGELVVGTLDKMKRIDKGLRATGNVFSLGKNVTQFLSLGGNDWLVESADRGKVALNLVDIASGDVKVLRKDLKESNVIMYEPSSQLVTLSFGTVSEVAHYDAKAKQLDRVVSVAKSSAYEQTLFAPLASKLANGNQVVQVVMRERPTVKWLRDARALDKAAATVTIDGSYAATDAAGHVYLWRAGQGGKLDLQIYADGKSIAQLPSDGPSLLWPDRAGKTVALVGANTIALFDTGSGKQLWAQELGSIQEALWLDDGSLAITSGGGIARLDAATGDVTTARCGWSFGLAGAPHPATSRVESLCAQLDR
jgi:WD40 repeat protein